MRKEDANLFTNPFLTMIGTIIIGFAHCIKSYANIFLLTITIQYLDKKPPGLQTVLDILLKHLLWNQVIQNIFWIAFLLAGFCSGNVPIPIAEIGIFILINGYVLMYALYQVLLIVKAILIFKGKPV